MADKRDFFILAFPLLGVEQVSPSDEGVVVPPVAVHSVNCSALFFPVDCHSFVQGLLVRPKVPVKEAEVLIASLDYLDGVCIDLPNMAHSGVFIIQVVHEGPSGSLGPI